MGVTAASSLGPGVSRTVSARLSLLTLEYASLVANLTRGLLAASTQGWDDDDTNGQVESRMDLLDAAPPVGLPSRVSVWLPVGLDVLAALRRYYNAEFRRRNGAIESGAKTPRPAETSSQAPPPPATRVSSGWFFKSALQATVSSSARTAEADATPAAPSDDGAGCWVPTPLGLLYTSTSAYAHLESAIDAIDSHIRKINTQVNGGMTASSLYNAS